eukprot:scaffold32495_cov60-Phaeocystis_antarctica.AAC.3
MDADCTTLDRPIGESALEPGTIQAREWRSPKSRHPPSAAASLFERGDVSRRRAERRSAERCAART